MKNPSTNCIEIKIWHNVAFVYAIFCVYKVHKEGKQKNNNEIKIENLTAKSRRECWYHNCNFVRCTIENAKCTDCTVVSTDII